MFVVFDELVGEAGFKLGAAELSSVGTNVSGLGTGDGEVGAIELGVWVVVSGLGGGVGDSELGLKVGESVIWSDGTGVGEMGFIDGAWLGLGIEVGLRVGRAVLASAKLLWVLSWFELEDSIFPIKFCLVAVAANSVFNSSPNFFWVYAIVVFCPMTELGGVGKVNWLEFEDSVCCEPWSGLEDPISRGFRLNFGNINCCVFGFSSCLRIFNPEALKLSAKEAIPVIKFSLVKSRSKIKSCGVSQFAFEKLASLAIELWKLVIWAGLYSLTKS